MVRKPSPRLRLASPLLCLASSGFSVTLALWCAAASAQDSKRSAAPPPPGSPPASASELYQSGKFAESLEAFLKSPPQTAAQHYNAGILAIKAQQLGRAHAHLSMAEALAPGNAEISALAASVQNQVRTLFGAQRLNAWAGHPLSWFGTPYSSALAVLLGLLTVSLGFSLWKRDRAAEGPEGSASSQSFERWAFTGLLLLLVFERGTSLWVLRNATPGVALDMLVGRSGPGPQFMERARVEAGSRVLARPSSSREGWILIRTPQETLAWVESTKVGLLFAGP